MRMDKKGFGYYDGPLSTTQKLSDVLQIAMRKIKANCKPVLPPFPAIWKDVVGVTWAPYTSVDKFVEGVLYIKVSHSPLLSLLSTSSEKERLLRGIRAKCQQVTVHNIVFRVG